MFSSPLGGILIPWSTISIVGLVVASALSGSIDGTQKKRIRKERSQGHMVQYDFAVFLFVF